MGDDYNRGRKGRRTVRALGVVLLVATPLAAVVACAVQKVQDAADRSH